MNKKLQRVLPMLLMVVLPFLILSPSARAQGGPPMLTDDPATPGDGMWEVSFLSSLIQSRAGRVFETPNVDLNYGFGNHIQFKVEAPWIITKEKAESLKGGPGNSMVGVKWRFVDEERHGFEMSIYPQLEFNNPTRSVERGLAEEGTRLFVPIEVGKKIRSFDLNGEMGYSILQNGPDEWEYGILFARQVTARLELMGEFHGSALRAFSEDELFFNAGSRLRLTKNAVLLISAGRTIRSHGSEGPQNIVAFGIQFTFKNRMPRIARSRSKQT